MSSRAKICVKCDVFFSEKDVRRHAVVFSWSHPSPRRFFPSVSLTEGKTVFYVTDGNIMYLTDASRSLKSCVIQHYAPVVGWGGGGTDA
jgi:hypothetical protein